ncbi:V-type proton ATPase 116 kDa subunit a isoform 4 [Aduncisulcus paluster]|uniref:V-type proton ATPase subunit a n=1 Tax=Aduncisulcus paluster TaxID=2918883 RepID=A0ABQ5K2Q8_9EUKA|nr:V-type proton ATPase 116 kDa subunit a isoform 4 [Aduncisulcus paluster]
MSEGVISTIPKDADVIKDMFRSIPMKQIEIIMQSGNAMNVLTDLCQFGNLQLVDLNASVPLADRPNIAQIRRCSDIERRLESIRQAIHESGIPAPEPITPASVLLEHIADASEEAEQQLSVTKAHITNMEEQLYQFTATEAVLRGAVRFFSETSSSAGEKKQVDSIMSLEALDESPTTSLDRSAFQDGILSSSSAPVTSHALGDICGVIREDQLSFLKRLIFRQTKGNAYVRTAHLVKWYKAKDDPDFDPEADENIDYKHSVVCIFYSGAKSAAIITHVCEGLGMDIVEFPHDEEQRRTILEDISEKRRTITDVLNISIATRKRALNEYGRFFDAWMRAVQAERTVLSALDKCTHVEGGKCVRLLAWVAEEAIDDVKRSVDESCFRHGAETQPIISPVVADEKAVRPTYIRAPGWLGGFQGVSDAYGVCTYGEINPALMYPWSFPALFGIMFGDTGHTLDAYGVCTYGEINPALMYPWSFPALFGIMFGDTGHTLFLLVISLMMIFNEKKLAGKPGGLGDIMDMLFAGRYIMLLIAIFGFFMGLCYGEFLGLGFNFFGTGYTKSTCTDAGVCSYDFHGPPVFGMDYAWHWADNSMTFLNSYKMKLSIIVGVAQMSLGFVYNFANKIHLKDWADVILVCIPEVIFFYSLFGYLSFLIIFKWLKDWGDQVERAPSITTTLINIFLQPGVIDQTDGVLPMYDPKIQAIVQLIILFLILFSFFFLMFAKTFYMCYQRRQKKKPTSHSPASRGEYATIPDYSRSPSEEEMASPVKVDIQNVGEKLKEAGVGEEAEETEELSMGEEVIQQVIHCIEFALSCVSHTASYLRLWALSLAHSQLAAVFYEMFWSSGAEETEELSMGEEVIQQVIHCIEFALSCVSHTASYLRLWALSLAHSQLAEVFYEMFWSSGVEGSIFMNIIGYPIWMVASIAVVVCMEGLSSFLHDLRLHWVEWQSKFFEADGFEFAPDKFQAPKSLKFSISLHEQMKTENLDD